jgi:DNA-binding XRE family transcriptional regulator
MVDAPRKICYIGVIRGGDFVKATLLLSVIVLILLAAFTVLFVLAVRALLRYLRSKEVRQEKAASRKSLGEALRAHRTQRRMTQEFVAEALGVSRQAVSKWENGSSDPSTANLLALAKLFGVSAEELLREVQGDLS